MSKTVIHINRHIVTRNRKTGTRQPCIAVRCGRSGKAEYDQEVELVDSQGKAVAKFVYSPDKPLKCGAQIWVETDLTVKTR